MYNEYMSCILEAVYDVLGFQMDDAAKSNLENELFDIKQPQDFLNSKQIIYSLM